MSKIAIGLFYGRKRVCALAASLQRSFLVLCTCALFVVGGCDDANSQVTDPHNSEFKIEKFDARNYDTAKQLAEVFRVYFPLGTDRDFIDHVLVVNGNVRISRQGPFEERISSPGLGFGYNYKEILKNFTADYYVVYDLPSSVKHSITPASGRAATAFYDQENKLKLLFVHTELVFNPHF